MGMVQAECIWGDLNTKGCHGWGGPDGMQARENEQPAHGEGEAEGLQAQGEGRAINGEINVEG